MTKDERELDEVRRMSWDKNVRRENLKWRGYQRYWTIYRWSGGTLTWHKLIKKCHVSWLLEEQSISTS